MHPFILPMLEGVPFSGWRYIKGKGFHVLKYTEKRAGKLSLRYLKGPFKISRSRLLGMGKGCRLLWKVYERGTSPFPIRVYGRYMRGMSFPPVHKSKRLELGEEPPSIKLCPPPPPLEMLHVILLSIRKIDKKISNEQQIIANLWQFFSRLKMVYFSSFNPSLPHLSTR